MDRSVHDSNITKGDGCWIIFKKKFQFKRNTVPFDLEAIIGYLNEPGIQLILITPRYFSPDLKLNILRVYRTWFYYIYEQKGKQNISLQSKCAWY